MNRGGLGARSLNIDLQQALNPPGELRIGSAYGIGDKVMQVENDYDCEVYNGDVGVVRGIDPEASEMVIEFDGRQWRMVSPNSMGRACLRDDHPQKPGLGVSGHRHSAHYPQQYPMLRRGLLYTAVTRGKPLVVIVGQKKAMAIAVRGKHTRQRYPKLREWLAEASR